ncbi:hypothetical protein FJZ19_01130 [Candidatus Pacearchaeota archaeon]|nr:hypothetical protein [Candidatus Pacearchaeota archaeon]
MTEQLERQIIELIATDRIHIPISSMDGKLKRQKPKIAQAILLPRQEFHGERVYARVEQDDVTEKARTMRQAIDQFAEQYPRHGKILNGLIEETRQAKETNLYFGVNAGCRLTADDYLGVMQSLGFSEATARNLYPELMEVSRNLARRKAREDEERSVLVG